MLLRALTKTDYPAMLELFRELDQLHVEARPDYFVHRDEVYPQEHYEAAIIDPECLLMGAFDEAGIMLGLVRATLWKESGMVKTIKTVCLDDIFVVREFRRRGIASALYEKVERWAKEQDAARIDLHVWDFNQDALALYRTFGMKPQRYVMEKKL